MIKDCRHGFIVEIGHKKNRSKEWAEKVGCKKKKTKMKKK